MNKKLKELEEIKNKTLTSANLTNDRENIRVVVGMATCGIAAGAAPVLESFKEEIAKRNLSNVMVRQTGCIGVCWFEPMVEVYVPGAEKVTYVNVKPDMVPKIVSEHLVNDNVVNEYTIGYVYEK